MRRKWLDACKDSMECVMNVRDRRRGGDAGSGSTSTSKVRRLSMDVETFWKVMLRSFDTSGDPRSEWVDTW